MRKAAAEESPVVAHAGRARRFWLGAEFVALFFGLLGVYALIGSPGSPIPVLIALGGGALIYLWRQSTFDRANLWRAEAMRPTLPRILGMWAIAALLMIAAIAVLKPDWLFNLPRERPLIWLLVAVFYPLLSVYPQELIFRGFLMHRYAPVFGSGWAMAAASAAAFGYAHIIYGTAISVVLTVIAGLVFARRYQKSRSLLVTSAEHALYGVLAFTAGLGDLFYHGTAGR